MPATRRLIRLLEAGFTLSEIPIDILARADAEGADLATIFHKYEA